MLALMHRVSCAINSLDKLGQDLGKDVKEIEDDLTNVTKSVQPLIPDSPIPDPPPDPPNDASIEKSNNEEELRSSSDPEPSSESARSTSSAPVSTISSVSSRTASASRTQYVVQASLGANADFINKFLDSQMERPDMVLYDEASPDIGLPALWVIPAEKTSSPGLNQSQVGLIEKVSGVSVILSNVAVS